MHWEVLYGVFALGGLILVFVLIRKVTLLQQEKDILSKKNHELELRVFPLELETIQYKLNPHLFKNVLNSIQSHAYQTYHSLDKLSSVLDYVLYESNRQAVSLKEEIEFLLNFIEINRLKINPLFDLRIKNKINEEDLFYQKKLIAPLISVDLIENAFKHTDFQSPDSFISIGFDLKDHHFILSVSNKTSPRRGLKKEKSNFGQENFRKRLEIIYKDNYQLDHFIEGGVYIAHLKINLARYEAAVFNIG